VEADSQNTSTGDVESGGAYTGDYAKTYTITIDIGGDVATARFDWTDTLGGGGTDINTSAGFTDAGVTVTFTDGTSPSFDLGDEWRVYVRPDIRTPTNAALAARIDNGKIMCSTCHNQHEQDATPFDPNAPGSGDGRHFQRLDNDTNQMCKDCHNARDVGSLSGQGSNQSHPVNLAYSAWSSLLDWKSLAQVTLPLGTGNTNQCMSCHFVHDPVGAPTTDGTLLREANVVTLCTGCHFADGFTTSDKKHLNTSTGALWPGGQYGTCTGTGDQSETCAVDNDCPSQEAGACAVANFPQMAAGNRGYCTNCHQPHGWPDTANTTQDYPKLLVDQRDNVCYTCHDGDPVTTTDDVYTQFTGGLEFWVQSGASGSPWVNSRHNVSVADQNNANCAGPPNECGAVGCANCHNPHFISGTSKIMDPDSPSTPFTATYAKDNVYTRESLNYSYEQSGGTDLDPSFSSGGSGNIGPAVKQTSFGNDTAASGGTYSVQGDEGSQIVYTVTVGPATTITTTTTGNLDDDTDTVVFGTPIAIGTRGVTITFTDDNPSSIGPATVGGSNTGDDTPTSGGTFTGTIDDTYTVTVSTGGPPGSGVIITDVCTGSNASGSTCESQGGPPPPDADTLTSSGTFALAPQDATYTVDVTTAGECGGNPNNRAVFSVTCSAGSGGDCGTTTKTCDSLSQAFDFGTSGLSATLAVTDGGTALIVSEVWQVQVTEAAQITVTSTEGDNSGPTDVTAFGTPIAVGTEGVTISFTDGGDGVLNELDVWTIAATAGDGLVAAEVWTITVDITTTVLPDMVEFCLTCHDKQSLPTGVTMPPDLLDMADAYLNPGNNNLDAHGSGTGGSSVGNGTMKTPSLTEPLRGPWDANAGDSGVAYAALLCTYCHSGHGTDNIFHLNTEITINGIQLRVGSDNPGFDDQGADAFLRYNSTTYTLPCTGGTVTSGDPLNCASPDQTGAQNDHDWGAFCTFCHRMEGHSGVDEGTNCRGAHMHDGGTF
jgi:predicted CXXCH cytochrome family protein